MLLTVNVAFCGHLYRSASCDSPKVCLYMEASVTLTAGVCVCVCVPLSVAAVCEFIS